MYPWEILELAPTTDAREIKRAYAKRLKLTKPDEKPAEFQLLHEAYKFALYYAANPQEFNEEEEHDSEEIVQRDVIECDTNESDKEPSLMPAAPQCELVEDSISRTISANHLVESELDEQQLSEANEVRRKEYERLIAQVQELLEDKEKRGDLREWHFLSANSYMLEEEFNWYLGKKIFQIFSKYEQHRVRGARGRYHNRSLPYGLVHYCDQLFSWQHNAYYLESEFGEEFCNPLLARMDEPSILQSPLRGLRGGVFVRGEAKSYARPTETKEYNYTRIIVGFLQGAFFVFLALNALRSCSPYFSY